MSPLTAPSAREDELAALIAEQEKDMRWGDRVDARGVSLDFTFEGGGTFSEVVGYDTGRGETAVRHLGRPQKWTKREIVKHIRAWVREHGQPPKYAEWVSPQGRGIPSSRSVARRFGTFNNAIRAAGFEPRKRGGCDPALPDGKRVRTRQRQCARLTSDDLAAAYVIYDRRGISLPHLAAMLWQKYGYPSPKACESALRKGFHAEGFRMRTKSEARMLLPPERRRAIADKARSARTHVPRGEAHARAKITEREVLLIRASSATTAALARQVGLSEGAVRAIRRGRNWRHVGASA